MIMLSPPDKKDSTVSRSRLHVIRRFSLVGMAGDSTLLEHYAASSDADTPQAFHGPS